jgi:hypothetical protein
MEETSVSPIQAGGDARPPQAKCKRPHPKDEAFLPW